MAVLALGWASQALAQTRGTIPPPPPEIGRLTLPDGELLPVALSPRTATYIEAASVARAGDVVELRTLEIYEPGAPTERGPAVELVVRRSVNCAKRTTTEHGTMAYDASGVMVIWLDAYDPEPIAPGQREDFIARIVCDGSKSPRPAVQGHAAARTAAVAEMSAYRNANPAP